MPTNPMHRSGPNRFRILGTLEFFDGQHWSAIGAPKQRALLAALLLSANQMVPADRLVAELWPNDVPDSAHGLLAGYVWRLRRALRNGDVLVTRAPGYRLNLPQGALDVHEYERLVAAGRASLAARDPAAATASFTAALALWRGAPLADVARTDVVMAEAARLDESRLAVLEARIGAEIELGRHEPLLPELKLMVSQYPLRERLHAHLMLTLYRCGQQAEALGAYHDLRRLLINELGIEPSKPLRELQQQILREDPQLLDATSGPRPDERPRVVISPRLLPPDPDAGFVVGGEAELSATAARLVGGGVCAVYGAAGTGKSTLARRAAHAVAERFPDGWLWLDLRASTTQPLSAREVSAEVLRAFGVSGDRAMVTAGGTVRWPDLTSGRRALAVLDDVADTDQVRPLLSPPPGCAVLLTGRGAIGALGSHRHVRLGRLSAAGSVLLLRRLLGDEQVDRDPAATSAVARLCEYLPLALQVAATRLVMRPEWTVTEFATRLADPRRRLDLLASGEQSVRESLLASVRLIERDHDTQARVAVHLLGALDLPVVDVHTVAALLGLSEHTAQPIAERLVDVGLIETISIDRYRVPDLVRLFARERHDAEVDAAAAVRRVIDHHVNLVHRQLAEPVAASLGWYRQELGTLRALVDRDDTDVLHKAVDQLRWTLSGTRARVA
ncbi:SARP family transcriptional regulator [Solihabitans fulvus]|uniref:SARP family transcriptional regulator n=1 Tax=Solihabitans fulvus TaxID=1892852 RepID=A0A5B2XCN4_9PSEU|nr:BTAD domain-containing putative transcriptional regulator [Solihabitans fulvus]KAA2261397.1 SARP family transcriptional regulator [Solihabitans fulvus]